MTAMGEIRPGLLRWELAHPEWTPADAEDGSGWEETVACYAVTTGQELVLVDPLAPPPDEAEAFWAELDGQVERSGPPSILVTIFWHARSSRELVERYPGTRVWAHEPAEELVRERTPVTDTFGAGDSLPGEIIAYDAGRAYEVVFWLPEHRGLVAGDVLLGGGPSGARLCPASWLGRGKTHEDLREALRPLLELPVELLLLTHGDVVETGARAALADALTA